MHRELAISSTVVAAVSVVAASGVRAKDEAAEEDHRDDEDGPGDDADPGGDGVEPRAARFTLALDVCWLWWRRGGGHGARCWFV
jgi:hypothetical protein